MGVEIKSLAFCKGFRKKFKQYPVGFVRIDIIEVRCENGEPYLFVAIDRKIKYVYAKLHTRMTQKIAVEFLHHLQQDYVFTITHILIDSSAQFAYNLLNQVQRPTKEHPFDEFCQHNWALSTGRLNSVIRG